MWVNGHGFERTGNRYVNLSGAVDAVEGRDVTFTTEIENSSNQPILVTPDMFSVISTRATKLAEDPEEQISRLNTSIAYNQSASEPNIFDSIESITGTVLALSGAETKKARRQRERSERDREEARSSAAERAVTDQAEKEIWETQYLRKNTLLPGAKISGRVRFTDVLAGGPLKLVCQIPEGALDLDFQVIEH